ncbi:hypothetical protein ACKWTF_010512 [Chironomus riparius]
MKLLIVLIIYSTSAFAGPLSPNEANFVKSVWDQVRHNETDMFCSILNQFPDIKAKFPQFEGKDLNSIRNTTEFITQAVRTFTFFSNIIDLSDNPVNIPTITILLKNLGVSHRRYGVTTAQMNEFNYGIVSYLNVSFNTNPNNSWNDVVAAAWTNALDNIFGSVFQNL